MDQGPPTNATRIKRLESLVQLALSRAANALGTVQPIALFVDPADVSGHASDANSGQTALTPIATTAEQNKRILAHPSLTADLPMQYMSDDNSGTPLDLTPLQDNGFNVSILGTFQVLRTGGTLDAGTVAIDNTSNQSQEVHTTDVADWAPFVTANVNAGGTATDPCLLHDTTTGAFAWIGGTPGTATALASRPVAADESDAALTIGNSYQIIRGSHLTLSAGPRFQTAGGTLLFQALAFTAQSVGPASLDEFDTGLPVYDRCSWNGSNFVGGLLKNCASTGGLQGAFLITMQEGLWVPSNGVDQLTGVVNVSNDTLVTGQVQGNLVIRGTFITQVFVIGSGHRGLQVVNINFPLGGAIECGVGGTLTGNGGLFWGKGNNGIGIVLEPGSSIALATDPTSRPKITGTVGDFGFALATGGTVQQVARFFDPTTGAYSQPGGVATIATTWANWIAAQPAGFNFGAFVPEAGSGLVN